MIVVLSIIRVKGHCLVNLERMFLIKQLTHKLPPPLYICNTALCSRTPWTCVLGMDTASHYKTQECKTGGFTFLQS